MKLGDLIRAHYCLEPFKVQEIYGVVIQIFERVRVKIVIDKILYKTLESEAQVGYVTTLPYIYCEEIGCLSLEELYTHSSEEVRRIANSVRREREQYTHSAS